ncbi:hypothetical protein F4810DRAFT_683647 [Camillea tinctor]|nr:hypothetical protein F4810DRAFT_683647 [Camillea tinctor]
MASQDQNVTPPNPNQQIVVSWMINDPKNGFQEHTLPSAGGPPKFVSISKSDMQKHPELRKALSEDLLRTASIDRQGLIYVPISESTGKEKPKVIQVPFINVQAQIGHQGDRHTFSHVNVVADKRVGVQLIRDAMNESMKVAESRWIVETSPGRYQIQANRPQ